MKQIWINCVTLDGKLQFQVKDSNEKELDPATSKQILDALFMNKKEGDKLSKATPINETKRKERAKKNLKLDVELDKQGNLFHKVTVGKEEYGVGLSNGIVFRADNEFDIIIPPEGSSTENKVDKKTLKEHGPAFLGAGAFGSIKASAVTCKLEGTEWKVSSSNLVYKILESKQGDIQEQLNEAEKEADFFQMLYGPGSVGAPFVSNGKIYLSMIRIPGTSLADLVTTGITKTLTFEQKVIWSLKLLQFCEFMQNQGIGYHGDLALRNIQVDYNPENPEDVNFYILDFGYSSKKTSDNEMAKGNNTKPAIGLLSQELYNSYNNHGKLNKEESALLDQNKTDVIGAGLAIAAIFKNENFEPARQLNIKNKKFTFKDSFDHIGMASEGYDDKVLKNMLCDDVKKRYSFQDAISAIKDFCKSTNLMPKISEKSKNIFSDDYKLTLTDIQQQLQISQQRLQFNIKSNAKKDTTNTIEPSSAKKDTANTIEPSSAKKDTTNTIEPSLNIIQKIPELWRALINFIRIKLSKINYNQFKSDFEGYVNYYKSPGEFDEETVSYLEKKVQPLRDVLKNNLCFQSDRILNLEAKGINENHLTQLNVFIQVLTPTSGSQEDFVTHYAFFAATLKNIIESDPTLRKNLENFITLINCVEKNDEIKSKYQELFPDQWNNFKLVASELNYFSCLKNILGNDLSTTLNFKTNTDNFYFDNEPKNVKNNLKVTEGKGPDLVPEPVASAKLSL